MERYAHTYAYDGRICAGTQDGRALPRDRWRTEAPVLVAIGEKSEPTSLKAPAIWRTRCRT